MPQDILAVAGRFIIRVAEGTLFWLSIHTVLYGLKYGLNRTTRLYAIYRHEHERAFGEGHKPASVLDCGQGNCSVFA